MNVTILKTVPGLTHFRSLCTGDVVELPTGLAMSLINDGYAEAVRVLPASDRETAVLKRGPGRPPKSGS